MPTITVNIQRSDIYSIAEGISVSISQHNGGTPSYEQLWASPDESRKLDIYYREAVSDLERKLAEWIRQTSTQFDLTQDGTDYALTLAMSPYWPVSMQGLLANKIQDYLVHAVTAGWLNDFVGLEVKQDYQAMASQDILDIRGIIYLRAFNFAESERTDDDTTKDGDDGFSPSERTDDDTTKDGDDGFSPSERTDDDTTKDGDDGFSPSERRADVEKDPPLLRPETAFRQKDNAIRSDYETKSCIDNLRHRDNDIVEHHYDDTDWSGTGIVFRDRNYRRPACCRGMATPLQQAGVGVPTDSERVVHGHGYTPSPVPPRHVPTPAESSAGHCPPKPHHKDPRIPDFPTHPNYPPITADGKGWSDEALYDEKGSEHYINDNSHN